ncbi:MAG: hypothetical protein V4712_06515 [Pseudomonadota bacterium]
MELIADILMAAGAFGAAVYCYVLSARLTRFGTLETGMGGAIAVLSSQVDDMTRALEQARGAAGASATGLEALTTRAEGLAARLELLVASLHDLPEPEGPAIPPAPAEGDPARLRFVRRRSRDALEPAE